MDGGSAFIEILLFGMAAAFLIFRLRNVLGRRMGHERDPAADPRPVETEVNGRADDKVVPLPGITRATDPLSLGIAEIQQVDRNFEPESFGVGARTAFELILSAFGSGDRDTLRQLTNDSVFDILTGAIDDRESREETLESTLIRIRSADVISAEMRDSLSWVTLKIVSEQINVTRDAEGHAISGKHGVIDTITDVWVFARDTRSQDPNWTLAEIGEPDDAEVEA
jgi:predicted lipid-binding transport protein (Tim44 family)